MSEISEKVSNDKNFIGVVNFQEKSSKTLIDLYFVDNIYNLTLMF